MSDLAVLRADVQTASQTLFALDWELHRRERACPHEWQSTVYDPYEVVGREQQRWSRTCSICGKRETTRRRDKDGIPFFNF